MMDAQTRPLTATGDIMVLSRADVAALMQFGDYVDAVADAFRLHTEGRAVLPPAMEIRAARWSTNSAPLNAVSSVEGSSTSP